MSHNKHEVSHIKVSDKKSSLAGSGGGEKRSKKSGRTSGESSILKLSHGKGKISPQKSSDGSKRKPKPPKLTTSDDAPQNMEAPKHPNMEAPEMKGRERKRASSVSPGNMSYKPQGIGKEHPANRRASTSFSENHIAPRAHLKNSLPSKMPRDDTGGHTSNSFFKRLGFRKKSHLRESTAGNNKDDSAPPRTQYIASCIEELPKNIQKMIEECELDKKFIEENFMSFLSILRFITKDDYKHPDKKIKKSEKGPHASLELRSKAEAACVLLDNKNKKKYLKGFFLAGKGGFGVVSMAKDVQTGKSVAVKKLPHTKQKSQANNFSEVGFLMTCAHPNVLGFEKVFIVGDELWIQSEYLEGGTLNQVIKQVALKERYIQYITLEIMKGLAHLHERNYAHRDIKSHNIMLSIEGDVKLIDFGLCCQIEDEGRVELCGSPYWLPPEMIIREPHGTKADIWSAGVTILEMFDQKPPYHKSRMKCLMKIISDDYTDIYKNDKSKSSGAHKFLDLCFKRDPKERASAADLLKDKWVQGDLKNSSLDQVLRSVFIANNLALSGI